MRRWVKVAAWAAVFLACAGIGATIAANTDPFPPGVDREGESPFPTVSPTTTPTSSPSTEPVPWVGAFRSFTYHDLYVGGRCTTRWRGNLRFKVDLSGSIAGSGAARLYGKLACDFPIAQTQLQRIGLAVTGHVRGDQMTLILSQTSIDPTNGHDFGGFGAFLPARVVLPVHHDTAQGRVVRRRVDENGRGIYFWSTGFQLGQVTV
jgi:hypothetical protein